MLEFLVLIAKKTHKKTNKRNYKCNNNKKITNSPTFKLVAALEFCSLGIACLWNTEEQGEESFT